MLAFSGLLLAMRGAETSVVHRAFARGGEERSEESRREEKARRHQIPRREKSRGQWMNEKKKKEKCF